MGFLTAEEIAGINLEGVDWAVLSACDTGVGEIKVGEGVCRRLKTKRHGGGMTILYREHFQNGKDIGESVRAASLQIFKATACQARKHPPLLLGSVHRPRGLALVAIDTRLTLSQSAQRQQEAAQVLKGSRGLSARVATSRHLSRNRRLLGSGQS